MTLTATALDGGGADIAAPYAVRVERAGAHTVAAVDLPTPVAQPFPGTTGGTNTFTATLVFGGAATTLTAQLAIGWVGPPPPAPAPSAPAAPPPAPGGGGGGGGGVTPTPTPTPVPTPAPRKESGGIVLPIRDEQSAPVDRVDGVSVSAAAPNATRGRATASALAFPAGTLVVIAGVESVEAVTRQAPLPPQAELLTAVVVQATSNAGDAITTGFGEAVEIALTIPGALLPTGAIGANELVVAYWDGDAWVDLDASVTFEADGSVTLTATVDHFTLFGVQRRPGLRAFAQPLARTGVTAAQWGGGSLNDALAAAGAGLDSLWVVQAGRFVGYRPGAPAFVNAALVAIFPNERLPAGTIVFVVRR